jgi:hypothetical protein
MTTTDLPASVAPQWTPRSDAWARRPESPMAGREGRPLFIGGCPRSGTTLLQVMLDMHPEMGMPRETNFIREMWWRRQRFGDLREPANRLAVAEWIFSDDKHLWRRLTHKRIGRKKAIREIADAPPTIGSIVERCVRLHDPAAPRWGDKRPAYAGFIGPLRRMFPDAQFINVIRDPRGVAALVVAAEQRAVLLARLLGRRRRAALGCAHATPLSFSRRTTIAPSPASSTPKESTTV